MRVLPVGPRPPHGVVPARPRRQLDGLLRDDGAGGRGAVLARVRAPRARDQGRASGGAARELSDARAGGGGGVRAAAAAVAAADTAVTTNAAIAAAGAADTAVAPRAAVGASVGPGASGDGGTDRRPVDWRDRADGRGLLQAGAQRRHGLDVWQRAGHVSLRPHRERARDAGLSDQPDGAWGERGVWRRDGRLGVQHDMHGLVVRPRGASVLERSARQPAQPGGERRPVGRWPLPILFELELANSRTALASHATAVALSAAIIFFGQLLISQ